MVTNTVSDEDLCKYDIVVVSCRPRKFETVTLKLYGPASANDSIGISTKLSSCVSIKLFNVSLPVNTAHS